MNRIKKFKKKLTALRRMIYRNPRPALNDLDRKLEPYLGFRNGFFIECGANDGYSQSNTYYLEKKLGWRGVLVEGIPELHRRCVRNRPNSRVFHAALVAPDFSDSTVTMHFADLMSVVDGSLGSAELQDQHLQDGVAVQKLDGRYTVEVPARTLGSILDEVEDLPPIDFFSLDVEGYEVNVLRGLGLERHRPRLILVEARFRAEVEELLFAHAYEPVAQLTPDDFLYRAR